MEREMAEYLQQSRICTSMRLWELPDQFIFEPTDGGPHPVLAISRPDGEVQLISELPNLSSQKALTATEVFGVVGLIRLLAGTYILVCTARSQVGNYHGSPVFRITSMKFLVCNTNLKNLSIQERKDEAHFLSLLKTVVSTPGLYFSYDTDLTLFRQVSNNMGTSRRAQSLWKQAEPRFTWNKHLLEELIEAKAEPYILPVIQGSFQTVQATIGEKSLRVTLISRRCIRRIGTRLWRRGADMEGSVANFVETEQLLEVDGFVASYVQIRGSIPVLWEQIADLTYRPEIKAICLDKTPNVVERHFQDLEARYGSILAIDLINQQGNEAVLSLAYANAMEKLVNHKLRYVPFDFHHICGQMHFERLSILYDQIADDIKHQGFFLATTFGDIIEEQKGVVRTNCVDCLDRTNVTQSLFARRSLESQLRQLQVLNSLETINQHPEFDDQFKIMWADHGDEISMQYSGTPALKGDFVRYGSRTIWGFLRDGYSALARYYLNNFQDGTRQDALDLITGHYNASPLKPSPFQLNGFEAIAYLPFASFLTVAGLTLTTISLRQVREDISHFFYSVVWGGLTAGLMAVIKINGRQFCSRPRLCKLC